MMKSRNSIVFMALLTTVLGVYLGGGYLIASLVLDAVVVAALRTGDLR